MNCADGGNLVSASSRVGRPLAPPIGRAATNSEETSRISILGRSTFLPRATVGHVHAAPGGREHYEKVKSLTCQRK